MDLFTGLIPINLIFAFGAIAFTTSKIHMMEFWVQITLRLSSSQNIELQNLRLVVG